MLSDFVSPSRTRAERRNFQGFKVDMQRNKRYAGAPAALSRRKAQHRRQGCEALQDIARDRPSLTSRLLQFPTTTKVNSGLVEAEDPLDKFPEGRAET
jgi:hypothetical protein